MHFNIVSDPVEIARLDMRRDAKWEEIDAMTPAQAKVWFTNALQTPTGQQQLLKYLFYKLHDKI